MASLFKPSYVNKASGKLMRTRKWYAKFRDADGRVRKVPLSVNKAAAQQMLGALLAETERERIAGKDPTAPHRYVPLADHLAAYRRSFGDRGHTEKQANQVIYRCRTLFDGCQFTPLGQLDSEAAQAWLAERRKLPRTQGGFGASTSNQYVSSVKSFGNWCVRTKRVSANPFQHLAKVNAAVDVRHQRRDLSPGEFDALVSAARSGDEYRLMSGPDRAMLYLVAGFTGLRVSELASLTPGSFALAASPPTVTVAAAYSKHRREDVLPLHPELVALVKPWLEGRPAADRLWSGRWVKYGEASHLIRYDLAAARSKWIEEAADTTERAQREQSDFLTYRDHREHVADFHALRHTFITRLVQSGVFPKEAKELARHSTITLTMDRYAHTTLQDTANAVARLSGLTGTSSGTRNHISGINTLKTRIFRNRSHPGGEE